MGLEEVVRKILFQCRHPTGTSRDRPCQVGAEHESQMDSLLRAVLHPVLAVLLPLILSRNLFVSTHQTIATIFRHSNTQTKRFESSSSSRSERLILFGRRKTRIVLGAFPYRCTRGPAAAMFLADFAGEERRQRAVLAIPDVGVDVVVDVRESPNHVPRCLVVLAFHIRVRGDKGVL